MLAGGLAHGQGASRLKEGDRPRNAHGVLQARTVQGADKLGQLGIAGHGGAFNALRHDLNAGERRHGGEPLCGALGQTRRRAAVRAHIKAQLADLGKRHGKLEVRALHLTKANHHADGKHRALLGHERRQQGLRLARLNHAALGNKALVGVQEVQRLPLSVRKPLGLPGEPGQGTLGNLAQQLHRAVARAHGAVVARQEQTGHEHRTQGIAHECSAVPIERPAQLGPRGGRCAVHAHGDSLGGQATLRLEAQRKTRCEQEGPARRGQPLADRIHDAAAHQALVRRCYEVK